MLIRRTISLTAASALVLGVATSVPPASSAGVSYDRTVLAARPVAYFDVDGSTTRDLTGHGHRLTYHGGPGTTRLPNGAPAMRLDGKNDYAEIADASDLSVRRRTLSIEAWVRVGDLNNERVDQGEYVHWLGKGGARGQEYAFRMYNDATQRSSRVSAYVFNRGGGYGSGSYFEDDLRAGQWMHVGAVFDGKRGRVRIYRDGVRRDSDGFESVRPTNGGAPLRVGTRQMTSFFQGAVAKLAIYNYDASGTFRAHVRKMRR